MPKQERVVPCEIPRDQQTFQSKIYTKVSNAIAWSTF